MVNAKAKKKTSEILATIAASTLVIALLVSWLLPEDDLLPFAQEVLPEAQSFERIASSPLTYEGVATSDGQEQVIGYVVINEADALWGPDQDGSRN